MKRKDKYKEIERLAILRGFKKNYSVVNADLDHVFTTSEESDIKELIDDGKKIEEIISIIFQW